MAGKVEHIGVVVHDLDSSLQKFASLLNLEVCEAEEVNVQGNQVKVAFLPIGNTNIELVSTTSSTGLIGDFLRERGEGVHHIAIEVDDIEREFTELRARGVAFVWDKVVNGSRGTRIAVIDAKELNGVYIELVQKRR